jgi:hypothetical protein
MLCNFETYLIPFTIGGGPGEDIRSAEGYYSTKRTAKKSFTVISSREKMLLNMIFGDITNTSFPANRGFVEDVEDLETRCVS